MPPRIISADSHITEHPDTYRNYIEAKYRDRAPHLVRTDDGGDFYAIPDQPNALIPVGLVAAAGKRPEDIKLGGRFEDWYPGGWDPNARLADQDRDGVHGEILYPTIGMVLCNHPDRVYMKACMDAYNRWIAEYCAAHPDRLFGIGQTALRTPPEGIDDLRAIKALGLRGVMVPSRPGEADYDDERYAPFFEAAIDLGLPISFHILTDPADFARGRGPALNHAVSIIRNNQDIIGMFVFGGVFDRHPKLRIISVEADGGWLPHWAYRMDHYYDRHRFSTRSRALARRPSEYVREHVYVTFQDDWVAFRVLDLVNPERFMWANDFPHSDSTWPRSQEVLASHAGHLSDAQRQLLLHDNVAALYGLA